MYYLRFLRYLLVAQLLADVGLKGVLVPVASVLLPVILLKTRLDSHNHLYLNINKLGQFHKNKKNPITIK